MPPEENKGQQTQDQEPRWLAMIADEAARQEARQQYLLHKGFTQKTQEFADQQKAWQQEKEQMAAAVKGWEAWHEQNYKPLHEYLQPHWEDVKRFIGSRANGTAAQPTGPTAQNPATQANTGYFENWDLLSPQQQAERQAQFIRENVLAGELAKRDKLWMAELGRREQGYQRYLDYMTDGFTRQVKDPNFNLQGYLDNAIKFTYGQFDPKELAYKATMGEVDQKKLQDEWFKKGREEAQLELKNKQQGPEVTTPGMLPNLIKSAPKSDAERETSVRQAAAEKGIAW